MSQAKNIIEGLEEEIGVPNAFGSQELDTPTSIDGLSGKEEHDALEICACEDEFEDCETTESLMDDDADQEEEAYEMYDDNGGYN